MDAAGDYQGHQVVQPGYVCLNCGAPALDLGDVAAAMTAEAEAEAQVAASVADVLCPVCETLVSVLPGDECPNCGSELEVASS